MPKIDYSTIDFSDVEPRIVERYCDNGALSHYDMIDQKTGITLASPDWHVKQKEELAAIMDALPDNAKPCDAPAIIRQMLSALEKCRDKFLEYVKIHQAKTPELYAGVEAKVKRNQMMVELCDAAISQAKGGK